MSGGIQTGDPEQTTQQHMNVQEYYEGFMPKITARVLQIGANPLRGKTQRRAGRLTLLEETNSVEVWLRMLPGQLPAMVSILSDTAY